MSLRDQISIRILLISMCILLLGGGISVWQARQSVSKEVDSSINLALQLIKIGIDDSKMHKADWAFGLQNLKQTRHLTIQLKTSTGEIINLTQQAHLVEQNKMAPSWFSSLVVSHYPKAEYKINDNLILIIQANPMDEITEVWDETIAFFTTLLLLILLMFISVHMVFNKTLLTIQSIVRHLKGIETGNYQHKLALFSTQEYDDIASAINHMTGVLNSTQQQNRALTQHSLKIQEEERQYLSQELHDEFGQSLTAIKAMAVSTVHKDMDIKHISTSIVSICDHLMTVVRSMMKLLHPLMLTELGLKATLEDLISHWGDRNSSISFSLYCDDNIDDMNHTMAIQIFRVIQESLTNIIRHAHANQVSITLTINPAQNLNLIILDDGQGFDKSLVTFGFGLLGMEERIKLLGGDFELLSQVNNGTQINVQIPL